MVIIYTTTLVSILVIALFTICFPNTDRPVRSRTNAHPSK